jgi:hypothetical protein
MPVSRKFVTRLRRPADSARDLPALRGLAASNMALTTIVVVLIAWFGHGGCLMAERVEIPVA